MGALSIAFDITIVGALALPWVLLIVHLFFFEGENKLGELLAWIKKQDQAAVAGVVLFAVAYTLGSAVSRIAYDVSNDDDLHIQIGRWILRVGATQDRVLTSLYCDRDYNGLLRAGAENPALQEKISTFQAQKKDWLCQQALSWIATSRRDGKEENLSGTAADIFGLQESAMLLKGEDPTLRLRQQHDQIMVLRGAAFNAMLACAFCVFGWGQSVRRRNPRSAGRWILAMSPVVFLWVGLLAYRHHYQHRAGSDPPYMEWCLLFVGIAGACLLWKRGTRPAGASEPNGHPCRGWPTYALLSGLLMAAAVMGWWSSQVAYTQQVIYSYDSRGTSVN